MQEGIPKIEKDTELNPEVRAAKLRGIFGQMGTLLKWKDDPDAQYKKNYVKLQGNAQAKSRFDALYAELQNFLKIPQTPDTAQYQMWSNEWDSILQYIYGKK